MTKDIARPGLFIVIGLLIIVAAIPRFYNLGKLGFYGDEETSSLPAYSLAIGQGAVMPSGMPYHRAMPLTWLNATSARIFGLRNEISYRIPSAIFGVLTIPLLFLFIRSFAGSGIAFTGALILAFSEWHIITSREARMYSPFLFFYLASAYTLWLWLAHKKAKYFILMLLSFIGVSSMHALGLTAILFALVPIGIKDWFRTSPVKLLAIAVTGALSHQLYYRLYVNKFDSWIATQGEPITIEATENKPAFWILESIGNLPSWAIFSAIAGLALGLFYTHQCRADKTRDESLFYLIALYSSAGLTGMFAATGLFHAAVLCLLIFFLLYARPLTSLIRNYTLAALAVLMIPWVIRAITSADMIATIKASLMMPFPYLAYIFDMSPGLIILFVISIYLILTGRTNNSSHFFRACLLIITIMLFAIGAAKAWGGVRYLFGIYPFIITLAAFALIHVIQKLISSIPVFAKNKYAASLIGCLVISSGVLGGHGIPQAIKIMTLDYGENVNQHALGFPFYPDHQGAGEFVKASLRPDDIVIAADMLQQKWYVNRVDFWLAHNENVSPFLYKNNAAQTRDIYVSSTLLADNLLDSFLKPEAGRVWIITSAEAAANPEQYLSSVQTEWLEHISSLYQPAYTARDGVTQVYLLNDTP